MCYSFGRLGHKVKTCPHRSSDSNVSGNGNLPYGDWLKAGTKQRGDEPQINETGHAKGHNHDGSGTPDGSFQTWETLVGWLGWLPHARKPCRILRM